MKIIIKIAGIKIGVDQDKLNSIGLEVGENVEIVQEKNEYAVGNLALAIYYKELRIGYVSEKPMNFQCVSNKEFFLHKNITKARIKEISRHGNGKVFGVKLEADYDFIEKELVLKPEILTHPNIPKPLHGINPRTIKGDVWWNKTRQEVYKSSDYHCIACGVHKTEAKKHKWLEAHEYYDIDVKTGICKLESIEPLCHYCHNFIHSGRLSAIIGKEKSEKGVKDILEHGFKILSKAKLKCSEFTLEFAKSLGCETCGVESYNNESKVKWGDWRLIFEDHEYKSNFQSIEDWKKFYSNK